MLFQAEGLTVKPGIPLIRLVPPHPAADKTTRFFGILQYKPWYRFILPGTILGNHGKVGGITMIPFPGGNIFGFNANTHYHGSSPGIIYRSL